MNNLLKKMTPERFHPYFTEHRHIWLEKCDKEQKFALMDLWLNEPGKSSAELENRKAFMNFHITMTTSVFGKWNWTKREETKEDEEEYDDDEDDGKDRCGCCRKEMPKGDTWCCEGKCGLFTCPDCRPDNDEGECHICEQEHDEEEEEEDDRAEMEKMCLCCGMGFINADNSITTCGGC